MSILIEAAVETLPGAIQAEREGASRIELCADLPRGGTTPGPGLLRAVRTRLDLPVFVMIRPRTGDFQFGPEECEAMLWDIAEARRAGADGVVIGLLDRSGSIELKWTARLAQAARPLAVTFHRAVDRTPNVAESIEVLARLGIDRVLTSGGAPSAVEGLGTLARLVREAGSRIGILPGGQIRGGNVARIVQATGAREIHVGFPAGAEPGRVELVAAALRRSAG